MAGGNGSVGWKEGQTYNCRVEGVQALESSNSGTPYLAFKLIVLDGEMAGERMTYEAYATEARKKRLARELGCLGFHPESGTSWDDLPNIVVGKECSVTMKLDNWGNRPTLKPDNMKSRSAVDLPGGVMGRIASIFGGKITAADGPKHPDVPF